MEDSSQGEIITRLELANNNLRQLLAEERAKAKMRDDNGKLRASNEAAAALVKRFEMESMALHKIQREWLTENIVRLLVAAHPAEKG